MRNVKLDFFHDPRFKTLCGLRQTSHNFFFKSLFTSFSCSNTKSRDFIVVPRNLLVKLNALEKQTDENYFENLKKITDGHEGKARTISPSSTSLEDFPSEPGNVH